MKRLCSSQASNRNSLLSALAWGCCNKITSLFPAASLPLFPIASNTKELAECLAYRLYDSNLGEQNNAATR